MDLKDIKAVIDLMKKNAITEFELEKQEFKIKLKRGGGGVQALPAYDDAPAVLVSAPNIAALPAAGGSNAPATATSNDTDIKSPMIGTFYRAPSPESTSYVEIGTEVNPDSVICIIEAMKVMNEIKAEARGVVTQICVDNGKPVEFGQPLFKIRPL